MEFLTKPILNLGGFQVTPMLLLIVLLVYFLFFKKS